MKGACYRFIVSYDGTDICGWQYQTNGSSSVVGTLKAAFERTFGHEAHILGASRTDAGVHAHGQVARFYSPLDISPEQFARVWNNALPESIRIRHITRVPDSFDPRHDVVQKEYWYHLFNEIPPVYAHRYGWQVVPALDMNMVESALSVFVGTHDFSSFCTEREAGKTPIRTIDHISVSWHDDFCGYRVVVKGRSFVRHMIRRIIGACVTVALRDDISIDYLSRVLAQKDPNQSFINAPAHGLTLHSITYR